MFSMFLGTREFGFIRKLFTNAIPSIFGLDNVIQISNWLLNDKKIFWYLDK